MIMIATLLTILCPASTGQTNPLFTERMPGSFKQMDSVNGATGKPRLVEDIALRSRNVSIDHAKLAGVRAALRDGVSSIRDESEVSLSLNLFDDATFRAVFERTDETSSGYTLEGRLEGFAFGDVLLVVHGGIVSGSVNAPEAQFRALAKTKSSFSGFGLI